MIRGRFGRRSMRACKRERIPQPFALHARSKQRACSGTLLLAGWHRSPPLWAEIDANVQVRTTTLASSHCTLAQSSERAVAPFFSRGGIDRRRLGRRSMRTCKRERMPQPFALHSRSEPRACSGTLLLAGWHRSPPPWAEIDANVQAPPHRTSIPAPRASADDRPCQFALHSRSKPRACSGTLLRAGWHRSPPLWAEIDARVQAPPHRTSIPAPRASADDRPCQFALHSRSKQRACSGTLLLAGWHRSPPLWAEIDARVQVRTTALASSHCTLAQSSERAVAPFFSRGGIDRRRPGRRSMRTCRRARIALQYQPHAPARTTTLASSHCTLAQSSERAVAPVPGAALPRRSLSDRRRRSRGWAHRRRPGASRRPSASRSPSRSGRRSADRVARSSGRWRAGLR